MARSLSFLLDLEDYLGETSQVLDAHHGSLETGGEEDDDYFVL